MECAQLLKDRQKQTGVDTEYSVEKNESIFNIKQYLIPNVSLSNYTGDYRQIKRLRCDSFVEYCYAKAGLYIPQDDNGQPLNLMTSAGVQQINELAAAPLIDKYGSSKALKIGPDRIKDWMVASKIDNPVLDGTDKTGKDISDAWVKSDKITLNVADMGSGPGLLRVHGSATNTPSGTVDIPFKVDLFENEKILTANLVTEIGRAHV